MGDDLAVASRQKRIAVATQVNGLDDGNDFLKGDIATDDGRLPVDLKRPSNGGYCKIRNEGGIYFRGVAKVEGQAAISGMM